MRTKEEYLAVLALNKEGFNNCQISRLTKIPRSTIKGWITDPNKNTKKHKKNSLISYDEEFKKIYSYVLGLYLGDGYINKMSRTYRMRITLDIKYTNLNLYARDNIQKLFPKNKVSIMKGQGNCVIINVYNNLIPELFPHLGKGKKYKRKIELKEWQKEIINEACFLQGLFHSDGCFFTAKVNKYEYKRFEFKNCSTDLHLFFRECCDKLNIKYTIRNLYTTIAKKEDVTKIFKTIGSKTEIKNIIC